MPSNCANQSSKDVGTPCWSSFQPLRLIHTGGSRQMHGRWWRCDTTFRFHSNCRNLLRCFFVMVKSWGAFCSEAWSVLMMKKGTSRTSVRDLSKHDRTSGTKSKCNTSSIFKSWIGHICIKWQLLLSKPNGWDRFVEKAPSLATRYFPKASHFMSHEAK